MSASGWRLFVAAPLPPTAAAAVWRALSDMRQRHPLARWTPAEQLHLTLVFLGATDATGVPRLSTVIQGVARAIPAFPASIGAGGGRPDTRRGGVAWLRLAQGDRQLAALARALDDALGSSAHAGRQPMAHVTVARRVDRQLIDDLRSTARTLEVGWHVERVVLYRSHTGPAGARYEELAGADLAAAVVG